MSPEQLLQITYNFSLACTLWATAIGVGLRISFFEMLRSMTQARLMTQGMVLNLLIIPGIVWLLTRILPVEPALALGLVLLAASAGGPYGLVATQIAKGDVVFAVALISVLQVSRVFTIPLSLGLVAPFGLAEIVQVLGVLFAYLVLPFAIGLALHHILKQRRPAWERATDAVIRVGLIFVIASAVLLYRKQLAALVASWAMALILVIQLASLALGYLLARPAEQGQKTLALTVIMRSSTTALLIATQVYGAQPLVAATVTVYGVTSLVISTLAAIAMARKRTTLELVAEV